MGIEQAVALIKGQEIGVEASILDDIWSDLEQKLMSSPVPPEHIAILDARIDKIQAGTATFTDWESLKSRLIHAKTN